MSGALDKFLCVISLYMVHLCVTLEQIFTNVNTMSTCVVVMCVVFGEGEYIVTHTPSHVTFQPASKNILNSEVSKVITSTFGFTPNKVIILFSRGTHLRKYYFIVTLA